MTENTDLNYLKQFINPIGYISKFHEAIIAFLCVNFISADEEKNLRKLFRYMDKEGKNAIGKDRMKECLEEIDINVTDEELDKIFNTVDENGTGFIEYQEFIRNACDIKALLNESNLKNAFHAISGNKETITGEDIKKFIFQDTAVEENTLKEYFEQFGMKYGDTIIFDEFFNMIKRNRKLRHHEKKKGNKKKSSKFVFEGPVIDEEKGEEEYEEDNENKKGNNNEDIDGDNEEEDEDDDDNKNDQKKLATLDKNITNNENKLKKLDDIINDN
jgi:Ca2+-binding EF-hand superfamily protein